MPPHDPAFERQLVDRCRRGDATAFRLVVERHGGHMLATARRYLPSEHDARDAVQDAFLSAYRSMRSFAGDSRLSTWLHRIVVNAALMKLRSRRRHPEESIEHLLPCFDDAGTMIGAPSRSAIGPEALLERAEMRAALQRAIERLPDPYRAVFLLRDVEELDTEEAARALEVSVSAVKTRLHRARQALRTLLEHELSSDRDAIASRSTVGERRHWRATITRADERSLARESLRR